MDIPFIFKIPFRASNSCFPCDRNTSDPRQKCRTALSLPVTVMKKPEDRPHLALRSLWLHWSTACLLDMKKRTPLAGIKRWHHCPDLQWSPPTSRVKLQKPLEAHQTTRNYDLYAWYVWQLVFKQEVCDFIVTSSLVRLFYATGSDLIRVPPCILSVHLMFSCKRIVHEALQLGEKLPCKSSRSSKVI